MLIDQVTNAGAIPALAAGMQFAARRQDLLAHNVANLSTPDFQPMDADPREFQSLLREAVHDRRARGRGHAGQLRIDRGRQVVFQDDGRLRLNPETPSGNVLFHDRNNRDLERTMQALAENTAAFRLASGLLRNRMTAMLQAIRERV